MTILQKFLYLFRKHPSLRFALFVFILILSTLISLAVTFASQKAPTLTHISPQIALPGDTVYIYGTNFGNSIEDSFVEIAGNRLTSSSYTSWTDSEIQIKLPQNIKDGLVYVVTAAGKSEAVNFTNKETIPVLVKNNTQSSTPVITNILEKSGSIGKIITIFGKNFGTLRNSSQVFFSIESNDENNDFISCSENNFDYEFWSNQEIRVRVPDGANTGDIYINTDKGSSNLFNLKIANMPGTKNFTDKKTYLLSVTANITAEDFKGSADVILRVPKPPVTPTQRSIEIPVSNPEPIISNYMNTLVHQTTIDAKQNNKFSVAHSFVVPVYGIKTNIVSEKVKPYSTETLQHFTDYLKEEEIVPANHPKVIELKDKITSRISNPYLKAKAIYNYMINNFEILPDLRTAEADVTELITEGKGDAYDFAMIFCALTRSAKIPCIPISGVYVDSNMEAHNHWWNEFYIEEFGWIPVDSAFGAGLEYATSNQNEENKTFYFANLDSQHVIFSRGWNKIKTSNINGKVVYRPKTYALQSIWEEASTETQAYSSFWSNVYVTGIY